MAANTREAYGEGWDMYVDFCRLEGRDPEDPSENFVCKFLAYLASPKPDGRGLSMGSVLLYRQGVARKFKETQKRNPFDSIFVRDVTAGLLRKFGTLPRRVKALVADDVRAMIQQCPKSKLGRRDAAILALGFACALRRSEICGLQFDDVSIDDDFAMTVNIRRSKTDQAGRGQKIAVPPGTHIRPGAVTCKWLAVSGITSGPLFQTMCRGGSLRGRQMHHSDVPRIIKHYASLIGVDPKEVSGHSLRAGFITSAAKAGARLDKIMEVSRHVQAQTVLKYIRESNQFSDHAGESFL